MYFFSLAFPSCLEIFICYHSDRKYRHHVEIGLRVPVGAIIWVRVVFFFALRISPLCSPFIFASFYFRFSLSLFVLHCLRLSSCLFHPFFLFPLIFLYISIFASPSFLLFLMGIKLENTFILQYIWKQRTERPTVGSLY